MDWVKVQDVMYNAIGVLTSSIDMVARMLTGAARYYASEGACGARRAPLVECSSIGPDLTVLCLFLLERFWNFGSRR